MRRFLCSPGGCRGTNTRPDPPQTPAAGHTRGCTPRGAVIHMRTRTCCQREPGWRMKSAALLQEEGTHLPQDHLFGLSAACEQQQAADQELLLQGETLGVSVAAVGCHTVAVNLREHPGHLRKADLRCCKQTTRGVQPFWSCAFTDQTSAAAELTFGVVALMRLFLPLVRLHDLNSSPGKKAEGRSTFKPNDLNCTVPTF